MATLNDDGAAYREYWRKESERWEEQARRAGCYDGLVAALEEAREAWRQRSRAMHLLLTPHSVTTEIGYDSEGENARIEHHPITWEECGREPCTSDRVALAEARKAAPK